MERKWKICLSDESLRIPAGRLLENWQIEDDPAGYPVVAKQEEGNLCVVRSDGKCAEIRYGRKCDFFRGLMLLFDHLRRDELVFCVEQNSWAKWLGPMVDCSRNAVMRPDQVKELIIMLAAMGHNGLMLYTEDTYEVPGEPYFGHFRGRYTAEELKDLDAFAAEYGIEMIPCIQGLAHLNAIFNWRCYGKVRDNKDILLAEEEKTYELLDKMIGTMADCFKSRFINLGMDEAMTLGLGKYLYRHGYHTRFDILSRHLDRVREICRKHGLTPMIWSDMYLRTSAEGKVRDYYDTWTPLPENIDKKIPEDVQLIFWDYYHTEEQPYRDCLQVHKNQLKKADTGFAGGAWKWGNFCPAQTFSVVTSEAALKACRAEGVEWLTITAWGDDGAEAPFFGLLPILQLYAERCYDPDCSEEVMAERFTSCTGGIWQDFMDLELPNCTPENSERVNSLNTPCKYELYQDVLLGLMDRHVVPGSAEHFANIASLLRQAAARNGKWAYLFETEAALCEVLTLKAEMGLRLKAAYDRDDRKVLEQIALEEIPACIQKLQNFTLLLEKQWNKENKPFGFDILDMRLGGVSYRLATARRRLLAYLAGDAEAIPELEEDRLYRDCREEDSDLPLSSWTLWSEVNSVNVLFHPKI